MQVAEWRKTIGEMVREHMRSPELEHYFSVKMNKPRAQLMITQLGFTFATGGIVGRWCRPIAR
jgi:hypothetical protein